MDPETYLSVSLALQVVDGLLEPHYFYIEGEVTSYTTYPYGAFLTVKDEKAEAVINCYVARNKISMPIEKGMKLQMGGRFQTFAKYGKLSFNLEQYQLSGEGSLERAYQLLIKKLTQEKVIDPDRQRALPTLPKMIGIVSSQDAAGFGDFMRIVRERIPGLILYLVNVPVQGIKAPEAIIQALDYLNEQYKLDVIVIIRGGGSLEELQAFNHEGVARAIARSKTPIMTGIGHERDLTIADMVADVRAATPTNAAQILIPTVNDLQNQIELILKHNQSIILKQINQQMALVERKLYTMDVQIRKLITGLKSKLDQTIQFSAYVCKQVILKTQTSLTDAIGRIELLSPAATLNRGFSITLNSNGKVLRSGAKLADGEIITTQFKDDQISSIYNQLITKK